MENKIIDKLAGNFEKNPSDATLSKEAQELVQISLEDIPNGLVFDYHAHILGFGTSGSGIWVNPDMDSFFHPEDKTKLHVYISASGIEDKDQADAQYLKRLSTLINDLPYRTKTFILALDKSYNTDGTENLSNTKVYVPNEYVFRVCQQNQEIFSPCISIHPYRKDAVQELEKWAARGVKVIKWIPNEMEIDASSPACESFYEKMIEYNMVLLTHTGDEDALKVVGLQHLGNPLLFIKPLDMGVKIIMAHCAGLGSNRQINRKETFMEKNYQLFLQLMDTPQYEGKLFGDISGLTQINRSGGPLKAILERQDIHHRLINGSDYPLPSINSLVSTKALAQMGYLYQKHVNSLNEIYNRNPLLFDFVLKRTLHHPEDESLKFSPSIFGEHEAFKHLNISANESI